MRTLSGEANNTMTAETRLRSWELPPSYRVILAVSAVAVLAASLAFPAAEPLYLLVRLDYALFASLILTTAAALADLKAYSRQPIASTLLLEAVALAVAWLARIYATVDILVTSPYNFYLGGFTLDTRITPIFYASTLFSSVLVALATALHHLEGAPLILATSPSVQEFSRSLASLARAPLNHTVLVAFLLGLAVRLTPELVWGSRLVGWDTVSYAAHLRDFATHPSLFGTYYWMGDSRHVPPLLDWILYPVALITKPTTVFKAYPPIAYGLLAALTALYSKKVLRQRDEVALATSLVLSLSLVNLRLSWDLHKQVLAQTLLLAALILIDGYKGPRALVASTLLLALAGLASEFGAAIAAAISAYTILFRIRDIDRRQRAIVAAAHVATIALSYALITWYLKRPIIDNPVFGYTPPMMGWENLKDRPGPYAYILIGFGPLIPLYLIGAEKHWGKAKVSIATATTLIALSLAPLATPWTDFSGNEWDRLLMSAFQVFTAVSLTQLDLLRSRAARALLIAFLTLPGFFAIGPPGLSYLASPLFSSLRRYPQGMTPAPSDPSQYDDLMDIAQKAAQTGVPIVADPLAERFVHLYKPNPKPGQIIAAQPSPETAACTLLAQNITKAYIIATANWTTPLSVTCQANSTTTALIQAKPLYTNKHYSLLEATLTDTPSQKC